MTLVEQLRHLFLSRPNEWLDGRQLAQVAGYAAWRTRVSDLRKSGMRIDNEVTRLEHLTITKYRYVPEPKSPQASLF